MLMFQLKNVKSYNQEAKMIHLNGTGFKHTKNIQLKDHSLSLLSSVCVTFLHTGTQHQVEARGERFAWLLVP